MRHRSSYVHTADIRAGLSLITNLLFQAGACGLDGSSRAAEAADARHALGEGPSAETTHSNAGEGSRSEA